MQETMTEMLPQPPPDAPMPPPSEEARRSRRWWSWILGVGVLSVLLVALVALGFFVPWLTQRSYNVRAQFSEAISNMKQAGLALFTFKDDLGTYPDDTMIAKLQVDHPGNTIPLGTTTANDYFRQLLVSEVVDSERIFFAGPGRRPDRLIDGPHALEKGECTFAYIKGATDSPPSPIVVFPLVKGKLLFDAKLCKTWGNKAAVLFTDNRVMKIEVDRSGRGYLNGKDFFDPSQPFWNGKVPDVKWPE